MAATVTERIIMVTIQSVVIFAAVAVCLAEPEVKLKRQSLINKRPSSGYIDVKERTTVLECARSCSLSGDCVSLFYTYGTGECQMHDTLFTESSAGLDNEPSAVYWEKEGQAASTPCTVPPPFVCPSDAVGVKQMWLPDCSLVKVEVFSDTTRIFTDAKTKCSDEGGQLYQITTAAKMNLTLELMRCPAFSSMAAYYIDGEYNTGSGDWETSDGTPLPITEGDFWYPSKPDNPGSGRCIHMKRIDFNFLWDDTTCAGTSRTAICDMP